MAISRESGREEELLGEVWADRPTKNLQITLIISRSGPPIGRRSG